MKKFLMCILVSVVFILFTGMSVYSSDKVDYIKQTFNPHMKEFIQQAEYMVIGAGMGHLALVDESDPKLHYYLIMEVNSLRGTMTSLYASHQIVLDGNRKMICNEGIRAVRGAGKCKYFIDSYIIHRNKNCEKETIQPVEVWDKILNHFFK